MMVFIGTCQTLCPAQETRERTKYRQLHPIFERNVAIKRYNRPAAGKLTEPPENVRPPEILLEAMKHLMNVTLSEADFPACYPFIWDRLWAIRQDLTLQEANCKLTRAILAQCTRFYIASATLCVAKPVPLSVFDPVINTNHLMDTIGRLLHLYEDADVVGENRPEIELLYVLWNVDSFSCFCRASSLHPAIRSEMGGQLFDIARSFLHGNMYRLLRLARQIDNTLRWSALAPNLGAVRVRFLRALNTAYSSQACVFPLSVLARWLDMSEAACEALLNFCRIPVVSFGESGGDGNHGQKPEKNVAFLKTRTDLNLSLDKASLPHFIPADRVEELQSSIAPLVLTGYVENRQQENCGKMNG
ncbi:SAC3 domain-containing protein 1-like [Tropilaelaps mercedesae]|uniref:SAC3 domain-containing protein 1-like n=1 Tax=Tropilaelaps mercedesae TaxID=418985 RepID=A0A1V9Y3T3_9ACAR|nr:SAC3 domain-containing protein 1-like [Tropilaelaps mercedesae]